MIATANSQQFHMTTSAIAAHDGSSKSLLNPMGPRASYIRMPPGSELPANVLFAVSFGDRPPLASQRAVRVNLETLSGADFVEVWYANGDVACGVDGAIRFTADDHFRRPSSKSENANMAASPPPPLAYRAIARFQVNSRFCSLRTELLTPSITVRATRNAIVSSARGEWRDSASRRASIRRPR
jgi:hypothetical protein